MTYNIRNFEQGTPEWQEFRHGKVGSSAASAIMGASKWDTPLSLYNKMHGIEKTIMTSAMERGIREEPRARQWACDVLGHDFVPMVLEYKDNPMIIASLDGFCNEGFGIEIKTAGREDHATAAGGAVPDHYVWQIHHQMMVTGAPLWYYVSWDGEDGHIVTVERSEKSIARLMKAEVEFLRKYLAYEEPEPNERDYVQLEDQELLDLYEAYEEENELLLRHEDARDSIKEQIIKRTQELTPHGLVRVGECMRIRKEYRKGSVDYSKVPQLIGVNLEPYRKKQITFWTVK